RLRVEHGLPARPLPPQRCLHRLPRAGRAHPRLRPQPRATPLDQAGRPRTAQVALQRRHGRLTQPDLVTVLPTTPGPRPDPHPGPGRPGPQTRPRGLRPDQASNPVPAPACWLRGNIESPTRAGGGGASHPCAFATMPHHPVIPGAARDPPAACPSSHHGMHWRDSISTRPTHAEHRHAKPSAGTRAMPVAGPAAQPADADAIAAAPPPTGGPLPALRVPAQPFAKSEYARFDEPWAMAFLPDGRLLVTEKAGRLRLFDPASRQL